MDIDKLKAEQLELNQEVILLESDYLELKDKDYTFIERKRIRGKIRELIARLEIIENDIKV